MRAVESVDLASTMLTLEERVIAPLPDVAEKSVSEVEERLSVLTVANAVRAVESVVLALTRLILLESVIALLPDAALTVSSASEVEEEVEEELSSLFAQPMITKLIIARKISKFVEFFIGTSFINNNSQKYTDSSGPDQLLMFPFTLM